MANSPRSLVVVFEDNSEKRTTLVRAIANCAGRRFEIAGFKPTSDKFTKGAFEDRLEAELSELSFDRAVLFVSDRDLSTTKGYLGLSEAAVSHTAERFGIPIALYAARGKSHKILSKDNFPGDGRIVLEGSVVADQAREAARLARGFVSVEKGITNALLNEGTRQSPATVASSMMGRPQYADRAAQYALGDQKTLSEVLRVAAAEHEHDTKGFHRRRVKLLGTWIYDSILRFPGLILDRIAAASYLNINEEVFRTNQLVQSLFRDAEYNGPFADKEEPIWWRPDIDDLLLKENVATGLELAKRKIKRRIARCNCSVNPRLRAGYVCMITRKPISEQESEGGLSWFPPGADLARVSKNLLEEHRPWLALY